MLKTALVLTLLVGYAAGPAPVRAEEVDLELVLAADGSGSIDDDELALQRRGYADAIVSEEVLDAVEAGLIGKIAIAYVEWGGPTSQHVIVDWHVVSDLASAKVFAEKVTTRPRAAYGYNSISAAIDFSVYLIENNAYDGLKAVIDVSGDGPNIGGRPVQAARDDAVAKGITINGLVIQRPGGMVRRVNGEPLSTHYERDVIGGPGAFVVVADETTSFPEAVRRKMVLEIAAADPLTPSVVMVD
ncbi:DUF1194 domain-containing protein [Mongoliimonas terrestris]|uniref:DUF1194 domain-containing protein n=1 Tax=Mongoliimonas terrestris TaxID=1709001 RepID=UPI000949709E|nr:DUF1194 domain-containing protein [Mongoliimonas terrestris]